VIRVRPTSPAPLSEEEEATLRRLVRACFQWRRKQLGKILREHPELAYAPEVAAAAASRAEVSLTDRPERVTPGQFVTLSSALPRDRSTPNL
jgi:16S rRNA (adenine1518-N6/adenine1519-N6)-dimethyltransferase